MAVAGHLYLGTDILPWRLGFEPRRVNMDLWYSKRLSKKESYPNILVFPASRHYTDDPSLLQIDNYYNLCKRLEFLMALNMLILDF
jgi:hypothetical protein